MTKKFRTIKPNGTARDARGLTQAQGIEMIRAKRRGATLAQLGVVLGKKSGSGNVLSMMGTWAFRYAATPGSTRTRKTARKARKARKARSRRARRTA